jgi:hypothetical protein
VTRSAIYEGRVTHARLGPRARAFSYRIGLLYLDLDELPTLRAGPLFGVERPRPFTFRRRDYLGDPARPLREAVLDDVERRLGTRPDGPVRLLTLVRWFGHVFNPVSFYYCFAADGVSLRAVLAEITNTPWSERHAYVLAADSAAGAAEGGFAKAFHVSPFLPMEQLYRWRLGAPGETLEVEMRNEEEGREVFRASLAMRRRPFTAAGLASSALRHPLGAWKVHAAIYWQAFRLWLRRTPFFEHPRLRSADRTAPAPRAPARV